MSPSPGGCRSGCVRARLRRVFCLRAGACFFSFRGFRLVTSPRCGGRFFARFEPGFRWCLAVLSPSPGGCRSGFRWCLAVLSPSPGGCRSGCVRARLRRVFCLRAGACFFSFRGFRLVTSPRCGGRFFARFEPGFRWCLAVLSPSPGGCRSGCVRAGPTEGSAAWAVALKSGRRPRRPARALAGGLRLVTEGYSGVPPLPPTSGGSPRGHLGVTSPVPEPL